MLPDLVSNPGPLTYESGALPIALRGPAHRSVYDLTGLILAILYRKVSHMLYAKYQPNWHSGSGEEVV